MKATEKILMGCFLLVFLVSIYSSQFVIASGEPLETETGSQNEAGPQNGTQNVNGSQVQAQQGANERKTYQFQEKTKLTFRANVSLHLDVECDGAKVGNKEFEMEIESEEDIQMTMNCTQDREQLGLMNGSLVQTRTQNRYRYQEGFVASIECNGSIQAKLMLKTEEQTQTKTWAYYDDTEDEWVPVQSSVQNGYLVCNTDHFSTWTVLDLESVSDTDQDSIPGFIGFGLMTILGILSMLGTLLIKRKK